MRVELTVADFLEPGRAGLRRPRGRRGRARRAGLLRHPDLRRARGAGAWHGPRAGRPRGRARGAGGHRQPELGEVPDRLLRRERLRARAGAHQLPADLRRDRLRRRALRGVGPPVRPRAGRRGGHHQGPAPVLPRRSRRRRAVRAGGNGRGAGGLGAPGGRHLLGELHVGDHGPAQGRAADPAQLLAERRHLRLAHRRQRPRRAPAHAAHVPLQRLGDAVRGDGHGRDPHRAAQGRRRGDPVAHRASRRHAALRGARRRRRHPGRGGSACRRGSDRARAAAPCASSWPGRRRRRRRSSGWSPSSGGSSSRSTASPRRRRCSPSTGPRRSGTSSTPRPAPCCSGAPAHPHSACRWPWTRRARCWRAPTTSSPATGSSPPRRRPRCATGGSTPATAATSTARTW